MNLEMKECIKDAYDDIMMSYYQSEEYTERDQEYVHMLTDLKKDLPPEVFQRVNRLVDALTYRHSGESLEALYRGTITCVKMQHDVE